jgi:ABC-type polysaccharide/polyol phosphate transport system ATPase subunit
MAYISCESVHIRYPVLHVGRAQSLLGHVARTASFGRLGRGEHNDITHVHALRGVSVAFQESERVGVIGRNGSGKSTFLKMLAGINWPSEGIRTVEGSVSSVLSLNAGLDMEKSGEENITFITRLRGVPRAERAAIYEDIAEFTQLGDYLRLPIRTYSSGMMVRLAFAIVTALPADILSVDEVIAAGDAFFMERASARIGALARTARVLIMATHSQAVLEEFCTHAIWIDQGQIVDYGPAGEVWERYMAQKPRFPDGVAPPPGAFKPAPAPSPIAA